MDTSDATATAADLKSGKIAYNASGRITGTAFSATTTAAASSILAGKTAYTNTGTLLTGTALSTTTTATAATILSDYTAYNNSGTLLTGTALSTASTATAAQIVSGYTAYNNSGTLLTGTITQRSNSGYTYVTPSSNAQATYFNAGYYPNGHGVYVYAAASSGYKIAFGTVSSASITGLSFTPVGFMMYWTRTSFWGDSALNVFAARAINSTSVSALYESTNTQGSLSGTASYAYGSITISLTNAYMGGPFYYVAWGT